MLCVVWTMMSVAQKFSFSDKKSGFAYGVKGECLLATDTVDLSIAFSTNNTPLTNCRWFKINFSQTETELKVDTTAIDSDDYELTSDSLSSTLKKTSTNAGYLIEYGDSSCNYGAPCSAFTWITPYERIKNVTWDKDTVICGDFTLYVSPVIKYYNSYGAEKSIDRNLKITYQTYSNSEGAEPKISEFTETADGSKSVTLQQFPYVNTPFTIEDITDASLSHKITTDTFYTQAVVAFPYMTTFASQQHEGDEGKDTTLYFTENFEEALNKASDFRSSGPIVLNLESNASPMANHFEWAIAHGTDAARGDFGAANIVPYDKVNAFKRDEPGLYCIELTVSNIRNDSVCEHKSYGCFNIAQSRLSIPNTFTPNGDGINDEFRVAYRSIEKFYCCIYDQWGRRVYESSDITQGWDGKIRSKLGTIGTYFYVIEATGTDGIEYKKKGTVNLIRTK